MKKIYLAGLVVCCTAQVRADYPEYFSMNINSNRTSQLRMLTRPAYQNVAAIWNWWAPVVVNKLGQCRSAVQGLFFYQQSMDSCEAASYFLMDCKNIISIQGDAVPHQGRDVRAEWFQLPSTTNSFLGLVPRQRQLSGVFEFNQDIATWTKHNFFAHLWIDVTASFSQVRNGLHPYSNNSDVIKQVGRPELEHARIGDCVFERRGLAEAMISIGATFLDNDEGFCLATASGVGLPGERRVSSEFLFLPGLGTYGHLILPTTVIFSLPIYVCDDRGELLQFVANIVHRFYVSRNEWRTFDLNCQREWSRYMLVWREDDTIPIPATNVLTRYVEVRPHSFVNASASLVFTHEGVGLEAGYELWARNQEDIIHACQPCYPMPYPLEEYGIMGSAPGKSASRSTISNQAADDLTFTTLKPSDIDFQSAGAPGTGSNRFHAAISYKGRHSFFASVGGFLEWPMTNACLKNYGCWGKFSYDW